MLKGRLVSLTTAAVMIGSASVLTTLGTASASAATTAAGVPSHFTTAPNTSCEYIQDQAGGLEIEGAGVNNPVTLNRAPASCFTLHYKFTVVYGVTTYTGYEYQDLSGHCLWDNGGYVDVGAACGGLGHPNEEFFGVSYTSGCGWKVADVTEGPGEIMAGSNAPGSHVIMAGLGDCWNFPS